MDTKQTIKQKLSIIGWGAIFIWWGIVVTFHPITVGMGAMGTGLIMLVVNAVRVSKRVESVGSTWVVGFCLLAWGAMDQAREMMGLPSGLSFSLALVVVGLGIWLKLIVHRSKPEVN